MAMRWRIRERWRRLPRRVRVPVIVLAVLVALPIVAQVLVSVFAHSVVERRASAMLGAPVEIQSLSVNLFTGRIRVGRVTVSPRQVSPVETSRDTVREIRGDVSVESIECDLSIPALIGGRLVIHDLQIDAPGASIVRGPDRRTNLDDLIANVATHQARRMPTDGVPVVIERLRVRNGWLWFRDESDTAAVYHLSVEGLTVSADGIGRDAPAVADCRAGPITLRAPNRLPLKIARDAAGVTSQPSPDEAGPAVRVGTVEARVNVADALAGRVAVRALEIEAPSVRVERDIKGRIRLPLPVGRGAARGVGTGNRGGPLNVGGADPVSTAAIPVTVEALRVRNGTVVYVDRSQGEPAYEMRIEDLSAVGYGLSTEAEGDALTGAIALTGAVRSGEQRGTLVLRAWLGGLRRPFNAEVETRIVGADVAQVPLTHGPTGDLRIRRGELLLTSRLTCRDDALSGDQDLQLRRLQLSHTSRRLPISLFGVPVETLNVFLLTTEGRLYVEFPLTGTIDDPHVPFEKALQATVAAGPRHMLERIIELPGDFLTAGADLGKLIAKPIDDALRKLFDPATWRIKPKTDAPSTRPATTRPTTAPFRPPDPGTRDRKPKPSGD